MSASTGAARRPWWVLLGLAIIAGSGLRAWQLEDQLLLDDEWHAVRLLLEADAWTIFTHFGYADHSIPLTLFYRALYLAGRLDEWSMHLPLLLAGIATLALITRLFRAELDLPTRALWTGLLAIAPMHVFLTRTARPYALTGLLVLLALAAFRAWWRERRLVAAALYVFATVLAGYLHLIALAYALLPFAWYGLDALRGVLTPTTRHAGLQDIGRLVLFGSVTILPLVALLLPPWFADGASLTAKAGADRLDALTAWRVWRLVAGTGSDLLAAVFAAVFLLGAVRLWRRDRELCGYLASVLLIGTAAIVLARPAWISHAGVLARYALPALPIVLLGIAAGLNALLEAIPLPALRPALAAGILVALFVAGPLRAVLAAPNQFAGHARYSFDYDPAANPYDRDAPVEPVPAFYRDLARRPTASVLLIEAPRVLVSTHVPDAWYQPIHRQRVMVGLVGTRCGTPDWTDQLAPQLVWRQMISLDALLDGAVPAGETYLVLRPGKWEIPPGLPVRWPDIHACLPLFEARFGPPVYRDAQIIVFDLHRSAAASAAGP